jgi:GrpB-like predicted nucleotidyltransferase (UPF0157 family)
LSAGADADPLVICVYNPAWANQFADLSARIAASLQSTVLRIEHVGSTAVTGLAGKPIIDVDVVLPSSADLPQVIRLLADLGYVHEGDLGVNGREAFRCPPGEVQHHLYVLIEGAVELRRHIAFRDALRADAALRDEYARLKRSLAARYPGDRESYTRGKSTFIGTVIGTIRPGDPPR